VLEGPDSGLLLSEVSLSEISVSCGQLQSENITQKVLGINKSLF
jgi:hypothetical protein